MITFEKHECREIYVSGERWGLAYYVGGAWSVYRAGDDGLGFIFVGHVAQLGEETIKELM